MKRRKHVLSVLGVSVLALMGMMAVSAVSAQAQTHLWLVDGANWSASTAVDALTTTGSLLYLGATILCGHTEATGTLNTASTAHATFKFKSCHVEGDHFCDILEPITATAKARFVLLDLLIFEPLTAGTEFTKISLNRTLLDEECLLIGAGLKEETLSVKGCVTALIENDTLTTDLSKNTHCTTGLTVGANPGVLHVSKVLVLKTSNGAGILAH